jgi:hypothetical protein
VFVAFEMYFGRIALDSRDVSWRLVHVHVVDQVMISRTRAI